MAGLDWTELLKPENGGPGESPGYREACDAVVAEEMPRPRRKGKSKEAQWTGLKHGSADP